MPTTSSLVGAGLVLALTACGTIDTHTDSNPRLASEMAGWRTYAWLPAPEGGDPMVNNDIVRARVQDAVDTDLARFGYRIDNENPDFRVGWTAGIEERVDVDWGSRKSGSATELNQAHNAFNANGYQVVDVVGYTENGDLQGFFVTYVRR